MFGFGAHKRTILTGMKQERENPEEIEGMQGFFLVNLEPGKMMGMLSEGMILDIGYSDGILPVLCLVLILYPCRLKYQDMLFLLGKSGFLRAGLPSCLFPGASFQRCIPLFQAPFLCARPGPG